MSKSKEELYEYFSYMQQEDNKSLLGGMAWDDIAWNIKYAEDNGISRTQLGFDFPKLLGYLIIDDETYEKKKKEYAESIETYNHNADLLRANKWKYKLVDDSEESRRHLADTYIQYAENCKELLKDLDVYHKEYLDYMKNTKQESTVSLEDWRYKMNTIVVNLFGEPSAGKSTCAMDITAQLKRHGINAEYVSEFAKDKVYENNGEVFKHQEYLFGKQSFKMGRVKNKVQVMVVDSPLILCAVYNTDEVLGEDFNKTVLNVFNSYNNRNYLLTRHHSYENEGRFQNEDEAKEVRKEIIDKLNRYNIKYEEIASTESNCEYIVEEIMEEIRNEQ